MAETIPDAWLLFLTIDNNEEKPQDNLNLTPGYSEFYLLLSQSRTHGMEMVTGHMSIVVGIGVPLGRGKLGR